MSGYESGVDVHEAQTDVNTSRPVADQEQITPGERVALSVSERGDGHITPEAQGTVRANGRAVGTLNPSPDDRFDVSTAHAFFERQTSEAVEITVGGERVDRLPAVDDEPPDAPGRQNTADPEPAQTVDRTIDERAQLSDGSNAGNAGPGTTDASDAPGLSAGMLAALAAVAVALFAFTNG